MSDRHHCPSTPQSLQNRLHICLCAAIQRARCLVEQHDGGIFEEGTSQSPLCKTERRRGVKSGLLLLFSAQWRPEVLVRKGMSPRRRPTTTGFSNVKSEARDDEERVKKGKMTKIVSICICSDVDSMRTLQGETRNVSAAATPSSSLFSHGKGAGGWRGKERNRDIYKRESELSQGDKRSCLDV